jgi:hypothetical protein
MADGVLPARIALVGFGEAVAHSWRVGRPSTGATGGRLALRRLSMRPQLAHAGVLGLPRP